MEHSGKLLILMIKDTHLLKQTKERLCELLVVIGQLKKIEQLGFKSFQEKFKSEKKAVRRWDKARKLCYGSELAKQDGCNYIMALDSRYSFSCDAGD